MNIKGALLFLVVFLVAGCGGGTDNEQNGKSNTSATTLSNLYMPAQSGALWRFDVKDSSDTISLSSSSVVSSNGQETVDLTWDHSGFRQTIRQQDNALYIDNIYIDEVVVDNKNYQVNLDLSENPALLLPEFSVIGAMTGMDGYLAMGVTISPNVGNAFGYYMADWSYKGVETIVTPTGSYEALHISYRLSLDVYIDVPDNGSVATQVGLDQDLWFAPGIGIVKLVDRSANSYNPLVALLSGFNKYQDSNGNISVLPGSVSIPPDSPWKNSHKAYKLDQLYGEWGNSYHCDETKEYSPSFKLSLSESSYRLSTQVTQNENCTAANAYEYVESGTYILRGFDEIDSTYLSLDLIPSSSVRKSYRFGNKVDEYNTDANYNNINLAKGESGTIKLAVYGMPERPGSERIHADLNANSDEQPVIDGLAKTRLVYFRMYDEFNSPSPEEAYAGWGMHIWNDSTCDSIMDSQLAGVSWNNPLPPRGYDPNYGVYFDLQIKEGHTGCANIILHKGEQKSVDGNMTLDLSAPLFSTITYGDTNIIYQ
ncbi:pullulanase-associated domain-containing protein [Photobacterium kasasachensis]|uniref:pullulanase-associated domain-containing protein n=1 Tax=Photobacterium kasasachensis TaxID=2910240 RepID=UPI003D105748